MKHFYEHVFIDSHNKNFYTECGCCKERKYADKLPVLCRSQKAMQNVACGKGGMIRQRLYNHRKALAVQHLARYFNHCSSCGKWACDRCYYMDENDGICSDCYTGK